MRSAISRATVALTSFARSMTRVGIFSAGEAISQ
jgi:hypothetical protein